MPLVVLLPSAVAAVATTLWSLFYVNIPTAVIIGIAWIIAAYGVGKFVKKLPLQFSVMAGVLIIASVVNLTFTQSKTTYKDEGQPQDKTEETVASSDPEGTIVVEAGDGLLTKNQYDNLSYIAESARGREAYLAGKTATASYTVEVATAGKYSLWVKLSDDALHSDESRSAVITINSSTSITYKHKSEDTQGWKYYDLGEVNLIAGSNKIDFTKIADTTAAYVMDEFKFIPKI